MLSLFVLHNMFWLTVSYYTTATCATRIVMKLDIESSEFAVLPDILFHGLLCNTINFIFGELHAWDIRYVLSIAHTWVVNTKVLSYYELSSVVASCSNANGYIVSQT